MVAPQADVVALLAVAEDHLRFGVSSEPREPSCATRSHLSDFRCVGWHGPIPVGWRVAIDAELETAAVPVRLARSFGADQFWERWTRAEALCKLADVPVVVWCRRYGLSVPAAFRGVWRTLPFRRTVVSVAMTPCRTSGGGTARRTRSGEPTTAEVH